MQSFTIYKTFLTPVIEISTILGAFITGYYFRGITDGIPFVQLRIPYISFEQFLPFIVFGCILWGVIFFISGIYSIPEDTPLFQEIYLVIKYSLLWFFIYISIVYLTTGFIFKKEIPRLIIFYVYFLGTTFSILFRVFFHYLYKILIENGFIDKKHILVLEEKGTSHYSLGEKSQNTYIHIGLHDIAKIGTLIRSGKFSGIISLSIKKEAPEIQEIVSLARIYGIPFSYPKFMPNLSDFIRRESFIGGIPVIEITSLSISLWERIIKRIFDILISFLGLIALSPIYILIGIIIKIEDPSGPIFFKNRRIGQNGKIFDLYKFRYMYWKYSVKDAYGINEESDDALKFEQSLKEKYDTREGPLYKIQNDPRKMKFGRFIERFSLDELPQLYNVLRGEMSLIGPRPHQPREVALYDEEDKQVLIIKPGITGMAQVYGRERNSFKEEVMLDRYYIEHYSLILDALILIRTFFVILSRIFQDEKPLAKKKKSI